MHVIPKRDGVILIMVSELQVGFNIKEHHKNVNVGVNFFITVSGNGSKGLIGKGDIEYCMCSELIDDSRLVMS